MKPSYQTALRRKFALVFAVIFAVAYGLYLYPGIGVRDVFIIFVASVLVVVLLAGAGLLVGLLLQVLRR